jgi:WD40 repeat protein
VICGLGSCSGDVGCWNFDGKKIWEIKGVTLYPPVGGNRLLPLQRWGGDADRGGWELVDTSNGKAARRFQFQPDDRPKEFSPDGRTLALEKPADSTQSLIDKCLRALHLNQFVPPKATERLQLVDIESEKVMFEQGLVGYTKRVQFSPGGGMLVTEEGNTIRLWFWDLPPRKSLIWFAAGAAILALPIALVAWRRTRKLRAA